MDGGFVFSIDGFELEIAVDPKGIEGFDSMGRENALAVAKSIARATARRNLASALKKIDSHTWDDAFVVSDEYEAY